MRAGSPKGACQLAEKAGRLDVSGVGFETEGPDRPGIRLRGLQAASLTAAGHPGYHPRAQRPRRPRRRE